MHRSRAPSIAPGTFFVAQPWADCITNMPGFNLRQAQAGISAWIKVEGCAHCECQVLDISTHGAKVIVDPIVPDRFELVFFEGGQHRCCEVVWRRAKMLGVKFIF